MEPVPADVLAAPASGWAGGGDLEAELAEIGAQLEAVAAVRDDLRAAVQRMDGLTRQVQSDLLGVHRRQEGAVQQAVQKARESVPKLQAAYAELAAIIARRPGEFYRLPTTILPSPSLSHSTHGACPSVRAASFSIDLEDYLTGLCGLSNEFPRFVMNRVTAGDYAVPRVAAAFLNDLFAAFRKLNLRNDMLRKRFDGAYKYDRKRKKVEKVVHEVQITGVGGGRGASINAFLYVLSRMHTSRLQASSIKYDLKKVEEVVYDVEIRGLAKTAAEPMQDA
ncbi:unnamed protein product [Closterium sp. NIES-65]|nr:unnamed protein product [Closterium sp. NIES-65]